MKITLLIILNTLLLQSQLEAADSPNSGIIQLEQQLKSGESSGDLASPIVQWANKFKNPMNAYQQAIIYFFKQSEGIKKQFVENSQELSDELKVSNDKVLSMSQQISILKSQVDALNDQLSSKSK